MKLNKVKIENFRSIESLDVSFSPSFRILVGKNESGKSNIIKAISLLDPASEISLDDVRESNELNEDNFSSEVTFEFKLNKEEIGRVYADLKTTIRINDIENDIFGKIGDKSYTLYELCNYFSNPLYVVDLIKSKRRYTYYLVQEKISFNESLKWNSGKLKGAEDFRIVDNTSLALEDYNSLSNFEEDDLRDLIHRSTLKILEENHPKVINWKYDEKNLLPERVLISEFNTDPNLVIPLKTMFELAGIDNIATSLKNVLETKNYHKINNYLEKVATRTTTHFRQIWKEYRDVEFTLNLDGESIIPGIKENNTFSLKQRSDGFKRFVTFLLMVSAAYETEHLADAIILIDEPDIALHPSGIRFLRDELIKISNNNIILTSTHSIFLIDRNNIARHYIVKKSNEITKIEEANDENLITEEVLYNALGFSFYEVLKNINIAFEGWRDKTLFQRAIEKLPNDFKHLKEKFKDIGITHINGVKEAQTIAPLFELVNRKYIVFSDSDLVALEYKRNFEKRRCFGEWITYKDLNEKLYSKTGEDFLKPEYLKSSVSKLKKDFNELQGEPNLSHSNVISGIDTWLLKINNMNEAQKRKEIIDEYKNILFNDLKPSNIDLSYYELLQQLSDKIIPNAFDEQF